MPTSAPSPAGVAPYLRVAAILFVLTLMELGVFSVPAFHAIVVPALVILSLCKATLIALVYMHLRWEKRIFAVVFGGPALLAAILLVAFLLLLAGGIHLTTPR